MKHGFSLIELLVVIGILGLVMAISLPTLSRARERAKIVAVRAELRQIGICLEMYMNDYNGKAPPTRKDCTLGWADNQLPPELVEGKYLPPPPPSSAMSAGMEDRFNPCNTYKYCAAGAMYQNGRFIPKKKATLYIPEGFPYQEGPPESDIEYDDPATSPVTWVIYSQGPKFDAFQILKTLHGPVPQRTWYSQKKRDGIIVRIRLKNGTQVDSFEGYP